MIYGIIKTLTDEFWGATTASTGVVRIEARPEIVNYFLYNSNIATLDRKTQTLTLRDCGHKTQTTKFILNRILDRTPWVVYASRGRWLIRHVLSDASFIWQDENRLMGEKVVGGVVKKTTRAQIAAKERWDVIATELRCNKIVRFNTLDSGEVTCVLKNPEGLYQQILLIKETTDDIAWSISTVPRQRLLHEIRTRSIRLPVAWNAWDGTFMKALEEVDINEFPERIKTVISVRVAMS